MDAGQARRVRVEEVPVQIGEEPGAEPAERVRAEGEEGDVAEVEETGVADDDVEPEREHDVHGHVEERVAVDPEAVVEDERERALEPPPGIRERKEDDRERDPPAQPLVLLAIAPVRRAPGRERRTAPARRLGRLWAGLVAHCPSGTCSPRRPDGLKTRIAMSTLKMTVVVQRASQKPS